MSRWEKKAEQLTSERARERASFQTAIATLEDHLQGKDSDETKHASRSIHYYYYYFKIDD
jgi:hypothetical protein